jgi:predicted SAM-dependent methyltransferase
MIEKGTNKARLENTAPKYFSTWKLVVYDLDAFVGRLILSRNAARLKSKSRYLNLGCGPLLYEGWINADYYSVIRLIREKGFRPDWSLDVTRKWKCPDSYFEGVFTQHLIEHLPYRDAVSCLSEIYRTLKHGHSLRVCVPSLDNYLDPEKTGLTFPSLAEGVSSLTQHHGHRSVWTAGLMMDLLHDIGFSKISQVEFGVGSEKVLVRDQDCKKSESIYIEARK